jgi:hypothetical protein
MLQRELLVIAMLGSQLPTALSCNKSINGGSPATGAAASTQLDPAHAPRRQTLNAESRMREHFSEVDLMQRGLVAGDLDLTRRVASHMASEQWSPRLRPEWQPYVESMQTAASAISISADVLTGARTFAALADTCAGCHIALGGPKAAPTTAPSEATPGAMAAHAHASRQMWWGLSTPSQAAWMSGVEELSRSNLGSDVPEIQSLQRHVTDLAKAGRGIDASQRAGLYAETLATCAACHRKLDLHFDVESREL